MKTVEEAFGKEAANELAMWAIDALLEPPETISTWSTRIPAHLIERGRAVLDDAGLDWRKLKGDRRSAKTARRQNEASS